MIIAVCPHCGAEHEIELDTDSKLLYYCIQCNREFEVVDVMG